MSSPYLSEVRLFAMGFAPRGWAMCAGQTLPINQNQALFSLLGTTYGGNGVTTFALPDMRGRLLMSAGQGAGLSNYNLGERAGIENQTLALSETPPHTHTVTPSQVSGTAPCKNAAATDRGPAGNVPAVELNGVTATYSTQAPDGAEAAGGGVPTITAAMTGGSQPHQNMQPYLVLNYCIALAGIFPSRT